MAIEKGRWLLVLLTAGEFFSRCSKGDFLFLLLTAVVFSRKPSRGCPSGRDSEDREGRGRCSDAAPSPLPTLRDLPPTPLIQALREFGCDDGSHMAESARLSKYADLESEFFEC